MFGRFNESVMHTNNQGCIKFNIPPPPGGGSFKLVGEVNQVGRKVRGRREGEAGEG